MWLFVNRYLVTNFKVVPRGTEGAVSAEGTVAGLLAAVLLASIGYFMGDVSFPSLNASFFEMFVLSNVYCFCFCFV